MLLLFFPFLLSYLLQTVYGFVDNIVLGRFVGKEGLAAVGGSPTAIINIINNFISGITAAITVIVAQNSGMGNIRKIKDAIKTGMFISIMLGLGIGIIMIIASPALLNIMNAPVETRSMSLVYMRLYFVSLVLYFIYQSGMSIFRAVGDSKRPLYFIMITAVTKIGFDLLLAGVFKLGVLGTSLATLLSYLICAVLILYIFQFTSDIYQYSIKDFGYSKDELSRIFTIGIPFSIQSMMFAIPTTFIQRKLNSFGTDAVAAYTTYNNVDNLFWCFSSAVSASTITMAGQNYGNKDIGRVRKIFYCATLLELFGGLLLGAIFYHYGTAILRLFTTDPDVLSLSKQMLDVVASMYWSYTFIESVSSVCKGCGDAKPIMYIAIFTILITRTVYILFYPQLSPIYPVYAFPISWLLSSVVYAIYFFTNKRYKVD